MCYSNEKGNYIYLSLSLHASACCAGSPGFKSRENQQPQFSEAAAKMCLPHAPHRGYLQYFTKFHFHTYLCYCDCKIHLNLINLIYSVLKKYFSSYTIINKIVIVDFSNSSNTAQRFIVFYLILQKDT